MTFNRTTSRATESRNHADVISAVRSAIAGKDLLGAGRLARGYHNENGTTPEALEALSWVARGALTAHRFQEAADYARQTHRLALRQLNGSILDSEPRLVTALGASIEVLAQTMAYCGRRTQAIRFLKRELAKFSASSIRTRIRKTLNLLTMDGQPAPELEIRQWIGPKPPGLAELRGLPVLLFFWAHYCEDSRAQGRVLVRILDSFEKYGLVLIGPTRQYGYLDEHTRKPSSSRREVQHIKQTRREYYSDLSGMSMPLSELSFDLYGVSTTPTLVLINRKGIVCCYHPGRMSVRDLAARLRDLLKT